MSCFYTNVSPAEVTVCCRRKDGSRVEIPYNQNLQCVYGWCRHEINDQLREYYAVRTKSRKSYKYQFWFLFNVTIVNSFITSCGKKTMKEFRVELAMQMIGSYNSCKYRGRPHQNKRRGGARQIKAPHYPLHIKLFRIQIWPTSTRYTIDRDST